MSKTIDRQKLAGELVRREVHYCASSLVSVLAQTFDHDHIGQDLDALHEQAQELCAPIPDYEEAAIQAGWTGPHTDKFGATFYRDDTDGQTWAGGTWEALCQEFDIEPYDCEVFEHWIVSDWFARRLAEKGEKVDTDFAGLTVWARTCTGQSISLDGVVQDIAIEVNSAS